MLKRVLHGLIIVLMVHVTMRISHITYLALSAYRPAAVWDNAMITATLVLGNLYFILKQAYDWFNVPKVTVPQPLADTNS